jgi:hypothetical protein
MEWGKGWKGSTIVLTVLKCTEHKLFATDVRDFLIFFA